MQIDPKGLEAAKSEGYALGVHEGRVELIVRAYLSALSPAGVTEEEVEAAARKISPHLWVELTHEQRMSDDYAFTSRRDAQERARKQARAALEAAAKVLSPAGTASEMEPVAWEGYWDGREASAVKPGTRGR